MLLKEAFQKSLYAALKTNDLAHFQLHHTQKQAFIAKQLQIKRESLNMSCDRLHSDRLKRLHVFWVTLCVCELSEEHCQGIK